MIVRGIIRCPCGVDVPTRRPERTRYCSNVCKYRYRPYPPPRPYRIVKDNPGWYGRHRQHVSGPEHYAWKGEGVGYRQLHAWVRTVKGPYPNACEWCGSVGYVEWANLSHQYRRQADDWAALCRPCHRRYDSGAARGLAVERFGEGALR